MDRTTPLKSFPAITPMETVVEEEGEDVSDVTTSIPCDSRQKQRNLGVSSSLAPSSSTALCSSTDQPQEQQEDTSSMPSTSIEVKIPALDKYNLRTKSIKNRIEVELKKMSPPVKKEPKPKPKPVPLSKYRRKTANARERTRMQVR